MLSLRYVKIDLSRWLYEINGIKKPVSATIEGWRDWHKEVKEQHPTIHNIVENIFPKVWDVLTYPITLYDNIRIYIRNRYFTQTHLIRLPFQKGRRHETSERMLYGMFQLLVDFIEVEKAHMERISYSSDEPKLPLLYRTKILRWGENRSAELGLKYLEWEILLKDDPLTEHQARSAQIQYDLYKWWTEIRPNRPRIEDSEEWKKWVMQDDRSDSIFSTDLPPEIKQLFKEFDQKEIEWEEEDKRMLMQLIDIRMSLST